MNGAFLTYLSDKASQRYVTLLTAFKGILDRYASNKRPGSPSNRRKAQTEAYNISLVYMEGEKDFILSDLHTQSKDAFSHVQSSLNGKEEERPEVIEEHIAGIANDLEHNIRIQIERDISSIGRALRDVGLRQTTVSSLSDAPMKTVLSRLRGQAPTMTSFTFQDRAGRYWLSQKLVRTLYRQSLVLAWNESALLAMALSGVPSAIIQHPDAAFSERGKSVAIADDIDGLQWEDIKNTVFHPNTDSWLDVPSEEETMV